LRILDFVKNHRVRNTIGVLGFGWEGLLLVLDWAGRLDILRDWLPKQLEFLFSSPFRTAFVAIFVLVWSHGYLADKSWFPRFYKRSGAVYRMLSYTIVIATGMVVGGIIAGLIWMHEADRFEVAELKTPPPPPASNLPPMPVPKAHIESSQEPQVAVPDISVTTNAGLVPSDFPDRTISPEMMQHLRRQMLVVKNTNAIDIENIVIRFQLPEPVFGELIVEDRPAGVEVTWHACRIRFSVAGKGAFAKPSADGGTELGAGSVGELASMKADNEVCEQAMDGKELQPTGIYQLKIARLPAVTEVHLAFLTSNSPDSKYLRAIGELNPEEGLLYYGDGRFQYLLGNNQTKTKDVFIPMKFDKERRAISSSSSSGEHGKWKISKLFTS
jgi:hypothetical protein